MLLPIILIVVVLVLAGAGVAVVKMKLLGKFGKSPKAAVAVKVGEVVPLDEFMLNLADTTDDHYIKVTIALGLKMGVSADQFKEKIPATRDAILMVLSAKHLADVRSLNGKNHLKKQLISKINSEIGENDVVALYFQDFATQ